MRMKAPVLFSLLLAATLIACSRSGETSPSDGRPAARKAPAAKEGSTAKAALPKAHEQALAWQTDARLQKVMTIYADREGKVSTEMPVGMMFPWQFIYMSEKTKKAIIVDSNGKVAKSKDLDTWSLFQPISEEFVDSDQALAEAVRNGYTPDESLLMELTLQWGPKKFSEPTWVIGPPGQTQYLVSGTTGKFVSREAP